jgi:uncharacterized repeat protein (TIGR01451 family)
VLRLLALTALAVALAVSVTQAGAAATRASCGHGHARCDAVSSTKKKRRPVLARADLQVALSGRELIPVGDEPILYDVYLTNRGPGKARAVRATVTLPAGLEFRFSTTGRCQGRGSTVTCATPSIRPCPYATRSSRRFAPPPPPHPTCPQFDQIALRPTGQGLGTISASARTLLSLDLNPRNNEFSMPVTLQRPPLLTDVAVSVAGTPSTLELGQELPYEVTVTNNGPGDAMRVAIGLEGSVVSRPVQTDPCDETFGCIPVLPAHSTRTMSALRALPAPDALGNTIVALVTVQSWTPDTNYWNNAVVAQTTIVPPSATADLGLSVTGEPASVPVGGLVTYTTTVVNHGPDAAGNVVVLGRAGPDAEVQSATVAAGGKCQLGKVNNESVVRCELGTLAAGESALMTASVVALPHAVGQNMGFIVDSTTSAYDPSVFYMPGAAPSEAVATTTVLG